MELDISCNLIHTLDSEFKSKLKKLNLSANELNTFIDLKGLETFPDLENFDLRFNTICLRKGYRAKVTTDASGLKVLDGIPVDPSDKVSAIERYVRDICL